MYRDLLPLITPGFLTARLEIEGVTIGVRSLAVNDMNFLRAIAKEGGRDWPFYIAAASIWMVDGVPLLEAYPYSPKIALDFLRAAHKSAARAVFSQALSFFQRMKLVNVVFESFLYEDESRRLWKATNNGSVPIWATSGIPGTERLGPNAFQASWTQWNRAEDDRLDDDYSWSLTKVLVSVQSSKSAKKLDGKDKARHAAEEERRSGVQDRAFYRYLGLLDEKGNEILHPAQTVFQPRTAAELSEEMRRWVAGEQDFHDKIVSDYKERVKTEFEAREAAEAERYRRAAERRLLEEENLGVTKPIVGYTKEEFARLRPNVGVKPGAKFIVEASPQAKNFNRYLREAPNPGTLKVENGRVVYTNPSTTPLDDEAPAPSLNELIAKRRPTFNG